MSFRKTACAVLLLCLVVFLLAAEEEESSASSWKVGVETDLVAWRIGELFETVYLGAWVGPEHWKFALTGAALELNPGHFPDGIARDYTCLAQLRADWSPRADRMGFWVGPSLLYENLHIRSVNGIASEVSVLSAGTTFGYLLKSDKFYFGPSAAIHVTIGSPSFPLSDAEDMNLPPWSLETGFRFGYVF
jgi:hypothetical protein